MQARLEQTHINHGGGVGFSHTTSTTRRYRPLTHNLERTTTNFSYDIETPPNDGTIHDILHDQTGAIHDGPSSRMSVYHGTML